MELPPAVVEALKQLPLWQLVVAGGVVLGLALAIGRLLFNTVLNGKRPPIMEGLPYVGGLIKFMQVGTQPALVLCGGYGQPRRHEKMTTAM